MKWVIFVVCCLLCVSLLPTSLALVWAAVDFAAENVKREGRNRSARLQRIECGQECSVVHCRLRH